MKTTELINTSAKLAEMKQAITAGVQAWIKAGELLVEILDEGFNLQTIADEVQVPVDALAQLEKIGRGQLCPQLLLADYPAARRMERLPMSEQERLMNGPVEVLVMRDGHADTLQVNVQHLTSQQVKQVFATNHVRSLAEQRQWVESQRPASEPVKVDVPYVLTRKSTVIFHQGCEMSAKELLRIAAQLQD
jgi:hypothetical protein